LAVFPADRSDEHLDSAKPNVNITPRARTPVLNTNESITDRRSDIRVETMLVLIPVSVTDPLNRFVIGLEKEDFKLTEDKQRESLRQEYASQPLNNRGGQTWRTETSSFFRAFSCGPFAEDLKPQDNPAEFAGTGCYRMSCLAAALNVLWCAWINGRGRILCYRQPYQSAFHTTK
jgi:hypothetical protein